MSGRDVSDALQASWTEGRWRICLSVIVVAALMLRIGAAEWVEHRVEENGTRFLIEGDANGYWHLGETIANGDDYSIHQPPRRVLRVPGFPLLLGAVIRVFGGSVWTARIVLAGAGAGCCWLTYLLGSQLANRRTGLIAAAFVAIHPFHVGMSVLILSETWFTFWMLASLVALARLIGTCGEKNKDSTASSFESSLAQATFPMILRATLAGALLACAVLIRQGFILWLVPVVASIVWFVRSSLFVRALYALTLVCAFGLTMLPWVIRNHNVTHHWVMTSLWSGPSLYDGLNPNADGTSDMTFFDKENVLATMSEYDMNAHYQQKAIDFVKDNPGRTLQLAALKAARFLQPAPSTPPTTWALWVLCTFFYALFFGLCVRSVWNYHVDIRGVLICVGPFLLFLVVHMVFVGSLRYRLPTEFPLAIVAAAGLQGGLRKR